MKKVIIMGASSGMGREVALRFLSEGCRVGVAARRIEALETLRQEFPEQVVTAQIDVTADAAADQLLQLVERVGGVDLYFHAAGVGWQNASLDKEVELRTVNTNGMGFTRMIDTIFNYMRARGGGHIAVISSIAGTKGLGPAPSYSATKAFQNTYIQALEQLANSQRLNIRFTDIRPGFVDTPLLNGTTFPMLMKADKVADEIVWAIKHKKHVRVIDGRYRILTACWRRIPRWIWRHINLSRNDMRSKSSKN